MILLGAISVAQSQTPMLAPIADESGFPGSEVCVTASVTNAGPPGYGPYLRITIPSDVVINSANLFGSNVSINTVGVFPPAPGNQLTDPITGETITGNDGDVFYVIQPPIGSVVAGGVPLDIVLCLGIEANAPVNVPVPVSITPVYQYGDTPTGDNGPITGADQGFNITPILVEFEKANDVPEGERPPGQDWPVTFTLTARVASGNTIDNLEVNDLLPPGFVLQPPVNVTGGVGCVTTTSNPIVVNCTAVNGTSGDDLVIEYSGYFADILNETACDAQTRTNSATLNGEHNSNPIPEESATSDVVVEHVSIQKGASPGLASPGQTIVFTVNVQISEYATVNDLQLTDTIPDGYTYQGNFTSSIVGIAAVPTVNGDGSTTLAIDATAAGNITGGNPQITFTYEATIDQAFNDSSPILASDDLTNNITSTYDLTAGASGCNEGSAATVNIRPIQISKEIINPQPAYQPGQTVTYRLSMSIPSGDTRNIVFNDFFPLPVFDATTIDTGNFGPGFDIRLSPTDTVGAAPTSITTDAATNSLTILWPDLSSATPQTISVDIDVDVSSDPFADDLSLANIFQAQTENSGSISASAVTPVLIRVRAPELLITKGIINADQGGIVPSPATLPVDGDLTDADGGDNVSFQITVENTGGAPAFEVNISDVIPAGLTVCSLSSVTDGNATPLAFTGDLFTTGITLNNPLAANDGAPMGGGAPYGADTALVVVDCQVTSTVEFGATYVNTATVNFRAQNGAPPFPSLSDDASITIAEPTATKNRVSINPNVNGNNGQATVGETIVYEVIITLPEGLGSNSQLIDLLDNGLTFESFDSIVPSSGDITASNGTFPSILSAAGTLGTRNGLFDFGTITNANTNNGITETITVTYTVLVNDVAAISNGVNRNNRADFVTDLTSVRVNAPNTRIREPILNVNKTVSPSNADAGDTVTYTIVVNNSGQSPAFDVTITDPLSDPDLFLDDQTVTTTSGSVTTGNTIGDTTVQVDVPSIPAGGSVTIQFDAIISPTVVSGDTVGNTASAIYSSLPGVDPDERDYGPVSDSATVNINAAEIVKVVLPATSSEQSDGTVGMGNDAGLVDLTIGEEVTFRITATLAEGVSPSVIITDTLPGNATGQMEVVSANVISTGTLVASNPAPAANIGPANVVSFDFGSVSNAPDGVTNDDDRIIIEVRAVLTNDGVNAGIETLTNNVLIQYNTGLDVSGSADVEVVEPVMSVSKIGSTTTADAGDTITYTVVISNSAPTSSARAFEVDFSDNLPAGVTFSGNLTHVSGVAPDLGSLMHNAGVISATWATIPLGGTSTISYDVVVDNVVVPEQLIQNTANINWSSMPGNPAEERDGMASDNHDVTVTASGLEKVVFDTSLLSTGTAISGPEDDVTIGEEVTYRITLTLPEGTTPAATLVDQLPNAVAIMDVVSSEIISVGGVTGPGISVGLAGTASDSAPADGYDDVVTWNLGDLFNAPDGVSNSNDQIVFEVVAVVVDEPVNQTLIDDVTNNVTFTSGGSSSTANANIDIVEPLLEVTKETLPNSLTADAGDVLTYRLTLAHTVASTADAYEINITDVLPNPGTSWINDGTVSGTCGSIVVDSSNDPTIDFTTDPLTLATGSCTIEYQVSVDLLVNPNQTYQNTVTANHSSGPGGGEIRQYTDMDQTTFMTPDPAILKVTAGSSLADTGDNQYGLLVPDLAVGETIDFTLTVIFPEGTTTNAVVQDLLPVAADGGILEALGATIDSIGGLTTTLPGTPVLSDRDADANGVNDTVTLDFGTVTNAPDGVDDTNDQLVITVTARVVDDPLNIDGLLLTNNATFTFGANTVLNADADVEIVEPNLGLAKSFGQLNDLVVPITLTLNNTGGTAPAYDLLLEDVFDTNVWDAAGFSAVSIPTGFLFNDAAGPGANQHTVSISSNSGMSSPDNSIEPNEVLVFVFNATLRNDVILPTTIPNTATLTEVSSLPGNDPNERDLGPETGNDTLLLPALDVDKSAALLVDADTSTDISPGDTLRYTIDVINSGDADATQVMLSDIPDPNGALVVGSVTTTQGIVTTGNTAGDTSVAVDLGTVGMSTVVTITYDVLIDDPLASGVENLVNQALVSSQELPDVDSNDPATGPDDDPTVVPVVAAPDLAVTKSDGGVTVMPGGGITYTINYENVGNQGATGVVITETVPTHTTFNPAGTPDVWTCLPNNNAGSTCTINVGAVAATDSGSVLFTVTVDDPLAAGVDTINNTVVIADDGNNGPDPDPNNNDDSDDTPVDASPDLTLSKDDGGATATPGGVVVYSLSYANVGDQAATGVVINETVPALTTFASGSSTPGWVCLPDNSAGSNCSLAVADLAAGDNASVDFAVQVDGSVPAGVTQLINNASVSDDGSNGPDPTPGNNADNDDTPLNAAPDMTLSKSDGVSIVSPGDTLTYVLGFQNIGNQDATGVVLSETVPDQSTFLPGSSTAGWTCVPNNNAGANCSINIGTVAAGAVGSVNFVVILDDPLNANTTQITNTASVTDDGSNGPDPTPNNNSDTDIDNVGGAAVDLVVTKSDQNTTAIPGGTVVYDITYRNEGNLGSTGVVITETVPMNATFNMASSSAGWTCVPNGNAGSSCTFAVGALSGGGASTVIQFAVTVDDPLPAGVDMLMNSVVIEDDGNNGPDLNPGNNDDQDNTPIDAVPDLSVTKTHQQNSVVPGDVLVYDVVYQNVGNQDATGVVITETVPVHTSYVAGSSTPGWTCVPDGSAGSSCTFNVGDLAVSDGSQTIQFAVMIMDTLNANKEDIINNVSINDDGSNGPDPDPNNNNDDETTPVVAAPDLYITKSDGGINASPGDTVVYTLVFGNQGNQNATGVEVVETVPANSSFNQASSDVTWNCLPDNSAGSTCTYAHGNMNAGDSLTVTFAVDVADPLPNGVNEMFNSVTVLDDGNNGPDPDPHNNTDDVTTPLTLEPPVGLKTGEFDPNDDRIIRWTFWWFNPNNNRDLPVFIFDEIQSGMVFEGNAICTAYGTSTCSTPVYNAALNRIELNAVIGEDEGAPINSSPNQLNNPIVISFDVRIIGSGQLIFENQANAHWDHDNDGNPDDDIADGQEPVDTDNPLTPLVGDPTVLGTTIPVPATHWWALMLMMMSMSFMAYRRYYR